MTDKARETAEKIVHNWWRVWDRNGCINQITLALSKTEAEARRAALEEAIEQFPGVAYEGQLVRNRIRALIDAPPAPEPAFPINPKVWAAGISAPPAEEG
jgi:hypothetical protein